MNISSMVKHLRNAGVPDDQILDAIVQQDEEKRATLRESARQRQHKCRERKALENNDHVTVTGVTSVTPLPQGKKVSTPSKKLNSLSHKENPLKRGQKKTPRCRLDKLEGTGPEEMPDRWDSWATKELGWEDERLWWVWESFWDYWNSPNARDPCKADWSQTWRNWCRKADNETWRSKNEQKRNI